METPVWYTVSTHFGEFIVVESAGRMLWIDSESADSMPMIVRMLKKHGNVNDVKPHKAIQPGNAALQVEEYAAGTRKEFSLLF